MKVLSETESFQLISGNLVLFFIYGQALPYALYSFKLIIDDPSDVVSDTQDEKVSEDSETGYWFAGNRT